MLGAIHHAMAQGPSTSCSVFLAPSQDAELHELGPNNAYPTGRSWRAKAGTSGGESATVRGLMQFDLSAFANDSIDSAFLYLYSAESTAGNRHHWHAGPNTATLYRITESWSDNNATWNDPPAYALQNAITVSATSDSLENKIIDVSPLLQDMIDHPNQGHGFMIMLNDETPYRGMLYGSSDHPDENVHPRLEVVYQCDNSVGIKAEEHIVTSQVLHQRNALSIVAPSAMESIAVYDLLGRVVEHVVTTGTSVEVNTAQWSRGVYIVVIRFADGHLESTKAALW